MFMLLPLKSSICSFIGCSLFAIHVLFEFYLLNVIESPVPVIMTRQHVTHLQKEIQCYESSCEHFTNTF